MLATVGDFGEPVAAGVLTAASVLTAAGVLTVAGVLAAPLEAVWIPALAAAETVPSK